MKTKNQNIKTFKVSCVFDKNRLKGRDTSVARLKSNIQLPAMWNYSSYRTENTISLLQQPAALSCSLWESRETWYRNHGPTNTGAL